MDIEGKVAVVTGAASGIGRAVAGALAKRKVSALALVDANAEVEEVGESIRGRRCRSVHVDTFAGDVTDERLRHRVFEHLTAEHAIAQILVPAAGITRDALAVRIDKTCGQSVMYPVQDFRLVTEVNLIAPIYWALEMVAQVAEDRHRRGLKQWSPDEHIQGTVIFIGSVSSRGNKGQIAYSAAKAGLEGAAATLTTEAIYYGLRCGVIHPGYTDTPMVQALGEQFISERILPQTQLRRLIRPEEIADAICFMISNSAVSGQLWADAGWHPSA